MRRILAIGLLVLALAGCGRVGGYPVFDREQTVDDELPAEFVTELDWVDPASSRLAASHDGIDYYLVLTKDGGSVCVAVADVGMACSGASGVTMEAAGLPSVRVVPAPARPEDGWIVISENLLVENR